VEPVARAHRGFDRFVADYLKEAGIRPSCRRGCFFCCFGWVEASLGEAERVLQAASPAIRERARREGERRARLLRRAKNDPRLPERHFLSRTPCPFLAGGRCAVYEERPLACRGVLTDLEPAYCAPGANRALKGRALKRYRSRLDPRRHGPEHYLRVPKAEAGRRFFRLLDEEARVRGFTLSGELSVLVYLLLHPPFQKALKQGPGAVRAYLARRGLLGGRYGIWLRLGSRG